MFGDSHYRAVTHNTGFSENCPKDTATQAFCEAMIYI